MDVVKCLIEKGGATVDLAATSGTTPLWIACEVCFFSLFFLKKNATDLLNQNGHVEIVEFLFEKGANIFQANKYERTPLGVAINVSLYFFFLFSSFSKIRNSH